jgi:DNA-binding CsgD family transcriptional regulator
MKNLEDVLAELQTLLGVAKLTSLQVQILRGIWEGKSYNEIAKEADYYPEYVKKTGYRLLQLLSDHLGQPVKKKNLRSVLQHLPLPVPSPGLIGNRQRSWGEIPDTSVFVGRETELAQVRQWCLSENCRRLMILGIGGVGKTALAAKLTEQIQGEFAQKCSPVRADR